MEEKKYNSVNHSVRKKDAMQLLLGKPVYVDDITSSDALTVKLLRSPYANAIVEDINVAIAKRMFQSRGLRLQDRHIRNHLPMIG